MAAATDTLCRSSIPVITAALAVGIEKKMPTRFEGIGLVVLTGGVMVAVWEGSSGSLYGISLCIAGARKHPAPCPRVRRPSNNQIV